MEINQARMEQALMNLTESDEQIAKAKALVNGLNNYAKVIKAMQFQRSPGKSVGEKEQFAMCSPAYTAHLDKIQTAEYDYFLLNERRNTETLIIDCWRSLNAARSRGMM
jgi:hypothetical protein